MGAGRATGRAAARRSAVFGAVCRPSSAAHWPNTGTAAAHCPRAPVEAVYVREDASAAAGRRRKAHRHRAQTQGGTRVRLTVFSGPLSAPRRHCRLPQLHTHCLRALAPSHPPKEAPAALYSAKATRTMVTGGSVPISLNAVSQVVFKTVSGAFSPLRLCDRVVGACACGVRPDTAPHHPVTPCG